MPARNINLIFREKMIAIFMDTSVHFEFDQSIVFGYWYATKKGTEYHLNLSWK